MILHTLDLFFWRGMDKSPSAVHWSLSSPCSMLLIKSMSIPVQGLFLLLLQEPAVKDFPVYLTWRPWCWSIKLGKSLLTYILSDTLGKKGEQGEANFDQASRFSRRLQKFSEEEEGIVTSPCFLCFPRKETHCSHKWQGLWATTAKSTGVSLPYENVRIVLRW